MDYGKIISNVLTLWFKDHYTLKRIFIILGLLILMFVVIAALVLSFAFLMFGDFSNVSLNADNLSFLGPTAIVFFLVLAVVSVVFVLYIIYQFYKVEIRALQLVGFETAPFNFVKFLKTLILLSLYTLFVVLTSWYHDKFRIYFIAMFLIGFIGIIGGLLFPPIALLSIISLLMFFPYMFVIIYSSIRLSLGNVIYLQKNQGIIDSVKESWELTAGKVIEIFVANFIIEIVLLGISIGILIIEFGIEFVFTIVGVASIGVLIAGLFAIIIQIVFSLMQQFVNPSIYAQLKSQPVSQKQEKSKSEVGLQSSSILKPKNSPAEKTQPAQPVQQAFAQTPTEDVRRLTPEEKQYVDKLVSTLKSDAGSYTIEELTLVLHEKGYSEKVVRETLRKLGK